MIAIAAMQVLAAAVGIAAAGSLPKEVPLRLDQGFWLADFSVGPQNFSLTVDTGSFAVIIREGLYQPNPTSVQTNQGEFIQFNGANADGTLFASETFYFVEDNVVFGGVPLAGFPVGNITFGDPLPGDGIVGFSPPASQITDPNDPTFFAGQSLAQTICDQQNISPCEFGLIFHTNGTGSLVFGPLDESKIKGNLTTQKTLSKDAWWVVNATEADSPFFVVNNQTITHIQPIFDNGTPNIIGPIDTVRAVLESVGYDIIESTDTDSGITSIFGTYNCSSTPARFGFSFPPSTDVHYIDLEANVLNRTADGQTCTANILGTTIVDAPTWQI